MPMRDSDTILGDRRGSAAEALDFARSVGAKRLDQVERFVREAYKLGPRVGIDPAIVVAQSALETNNWRDEPWNRKLNPAGIGVTDDLDHGFDWPNGESAARGQLVHLWLYAEGRSLHDALEPFLHLDPRRDAIPREFLGRTTTLRSLGGRWASVEDYGRRITNRSRDLFANLPNQRPPAPSPETAAPSLPIVKDFIPRGNRNRSGRKFPARDLVITVHETNNPNSNALGERDFFHGGGGSKHVAVHFAVDEDRAVQLLPLDEQGKHIGSDEGDGTSVAIETCVATFMDWARVRRNLAQLIARIADGDETFDWGSGTSRDRFSISRVRQHNNWSPANPCPRNIRKERFWDKLLELVDEASQGQGSAAVPDNAWKRDRFGSKTVRRTIDGQRQEIVVAYNTRGEISRLWERRGAATGSWPRFERHRQFEERREFWLFEDGFVIWRPNSAAPARHLTAAAGEEAVEGIDAGWKRDRFGRKTVTRTVDGQPQEFTVRYDADDPVSQLWEQRGAETGCWPRFVQYDQADDGREFWAFKGGFTATRRDADAPMRALTGASASDVEGIDEAWKRRRFGSKTARRIIDNVRQEFVISFNPDGEVSRLWERHGAATGNWPPFRTYLQDKERQEFWIFADGFTVWRPKSTEPVRILAER